MAGDRSDRSGPSAAMLEQALESILEEVVKDYRIDRPRARRLVEEAAGRDRKLLAAVESAPSLDKLQRTRAFRDARTAAKRKVYYALRQYKSASEGPADLAGAVQALGGAPEPEDRDRLVRTILETHTSTRERLEDAESFHRQLLGAIGTPRTLLDVGSGVYPLMFPFGRLASPLERYVAVDRDPESVAAVAAYAAARGDGLLLAVHWSLEEGWDALAAATGIAVYDVAFLFKVVPVVERQHPDLLPVLAATPADLLIVTGSRQSMTKRRSIEHREAASLRRFARLAARPVLGELAAAEEVALVLGASDPRRLDSSFSPL